MTSEQKIDQEKLMKFAFQVVGDVGAAMSGVLVALGDRLGLYRAMASSGPITSHELGKLTGTAERYVREWLGNQTAGGYVTYDPATDRYTLPPEQAACLASEDSPTNLLGAFQILSAMYAGEDRAVTQFRTGAGCAWGKQHPCLFQGTERFFRSAYLGHLVNDWIPSLTLGRDRLERGARVADVGCGHGASTLILAQAFPRSTFVGIDSHPESIEHARKAAVKAGLGDRVRFEVAEAAAFGGGPYDLVCTFDCLHDMENPAAAARHVKASLRDDGSWMIVEPLAADKVEDNINPVSRVYYAASTMVCVPHSLSGQGPALGAQAGQRRLSRIVVEEGGFASLRRTSATPFNMVLEGRLR